jgi:PAS domain S-box-containing protein
MANSGANTYIDKYSVLFLRVTRLAGLLIPFVAVAYGIASAASIVGRSPVFNHTGFVVLSVLFIGLGILQSVLKASTPFNLGIYLVFYHLFATFYFYVGPGFLSPIAFCWILLAFITEIFYGKLGGIISLSAVTLTAAIIYAAEPQKTFQITFEYGVYLSIIIVSCVLVVLLRRVQLVEHQDLMLTQIEEKFQREQLTALINSVGMAIASTSTTGTIRIYNPALLDLLDTKEHLAGKQLDEVFHLYDAAGNPMSLQKILSESELLVERDDLSHQFSNGERMNLSISFAPIQGSHTATTVNPDGYIFIVRDVTKAKSLEEERKEFISVVSHELRTPLAIVEGAISLLQYQVENKKDPTEYIAMIKSAHEQVLYLASMVQDLSTLSRVERGASDAVETIDCSELLNGLYHRYLKRTTNRGLKLVLDLPTEAAQVVCSRLYLEEILQNFITNAIKYTDTGTITIAAVNQDDAVEFSVKDTGIGISKSDQKRIFDKFYRSEDYLTRKTSGTGLGLYVVHKLARKLGANIIVKSELKHGSKFSFILRKTPADPTGEL